MDGLILLIAVLNSIQSDRFLFSSSSASNQLRQQFTLKIVYRFKRRLELPARVNFACDLSKYRSPTAYYILD